MGKRIIIGCGNYTMGDDGIGPHVIDAIASHHLNGDFEAVDLGTDAMALLAYFNSDIEKLVIIDTVYMDAEPGTVKVFNPENVFSRKQLGGLDIHESDIIKIIEQGTAAGLPIPSISVIGIQPDEIIPGVELSSNVESHLDAIIRQAIDEVYKE